MPCRVGVDTGGTFTDLILVNEDSGDLVIHKLPSTPDNPGLAVLEGVGRLLDMARIPARDVTFLIHGTTVATNALLERKGAKCALITTLGFRDVLQIGRQNRPRLYDFWAKRAEPLISRRWRYEIPERILHDGRTLIPLDEQATFQVVKELKEEGIESVAISLLHSYANPRHEQRIKDILKREIPGVFLSVSSDILPEFREYERTSTVAVNAFVMPKVSRYVDLLVDELRRLSLGSDLYIMQSNGGVIAAATAKEVSARTVLSGPAGGVLAGLHVGGLTGRSNVITMDMGGTSLDVSLIFDGRPTLTTEGEVGGHPIKLPMIDINTIGAGGGSIAWLDAGGALRVGPRSAGADPGPVCYSKGGTEPTVTDANVILGRLNPEYLLAGRMRIDAEAADEAVKRSIADPMGVDAVRAAEGIIRVVNANMARAIRVVSVEKGYDLREFSLVVFGGAGPLHGAELARDLGIPEVIVPPFPGITSAQGMLAADVRHDYVRTNVTLLTSVAPGDLNRTYQELEEEAKSQLLEEGFTGDAVVLMRSADLRYHGQAYELCVPVPAGMLSEIDLADLAEDFHSAHLKAYGYDRRGEILELVNLRVAAFGKLPGLRARRSESGTSRLPVPAEYRDVVLDGVFYKCPVFQRDALCTGDRIAGPAIIEQMDSTTLLWPKQDLVVDEYFNLVIRTGNGGTTYAGRRSI